MSRKEIVQQLMEKAQNGVIETMQSERWHEFLGFLTQFRTYSPNNAALIFAQDDKASLVKGYRQWEKLGRQVRKGEKAIKILAPLLKKVEDEETGEEKKVCYGYRYVNVFDIRQTEGDNIPLPSDDMHTDDCADILAKLEATCRNKGLIVEYTDDLKYLSYGTYKMGEGAIQIRKGMASDDQLRTLVHELAHHLTLPLAESYREGELIAESVSYVVMHHLGKDTSEFAFDYLASWAKGQPEKLMELVEVIHQASRQILEDWIEVGTEQTAA